MASLFCKYCNKKSSRIDNLKRHERKCDAKNVKIDLQTTQQKLVKTVKEKKQIRKSLEDDSKGADIIMREFANRITKVTAETKDPEEKDKKILKLTKAFGEQKVDILNEYTNEDNNYLTDIDINSSIVKEYIDNTQEKVEKIMKDINYLPAHPEEIENINEFIDTHLIFRRLVDLVCKYIKENGVFRQYCWSIRKRHENSKNDIFTKLNIENEIKWYQNKNIETFKSTFTVLIKHIKTVLCEYAKEHKNDRKQALVTSITSYLRNKSSLNTHPIYQQMFLDLLAEKLELTFSILSQIMEASSIFVTNINGDNNVVVYNIANIMRQNYKEAKQYNPMKDKNRMYKFNEQE